MIAVLTLGDLLTVHANAPEEKHVFHITEETLGGALQALARQAKVQLLYSYDLATSKDIHPVNGEYTVTEALDLLLRDTGFSGGLTARGIITVTPAEAKTKPVKEEHVLTQERKRGLLASIATILFGAGVASGVGAQDASTDGDFVYEEVVITGEKIGKSLKDTTTAITVITGSDGESRSVYDLIEFVPNVVANPFGVPNIRGVEGTGTALGSFTFFSGARPRVSTSVDGMTDVWSGYVNGEAGMWDVKQVEFLRGPQSTTQGRNTIGGAIIITTKEPSFDWEAGARVGYETERKNFQYAGVVSGPIVDDTLAFRLSVDGFSGHSFIDYTSNSGDFPWDPSETIDMNVRGKLLFKPSDDLTLKLTVVRRDQKGEYAQYVTGPDFFDYKFVADLATRTNARYQNTETTAVSFDVEYDFNEDLSGFLQAGYVDYHFEFDEHPGSITQVTEQENKTLEGRLVYNPEESSITGVAGFYYLKSSDDLYVGNNLYAADDNIETMAFFTDANVSLTDKLSMEIGGRIENEKQNRAVQLLSRNNAYDFIVDKTIFLPKIGFRYDLTDTITVGASARKGYNAGGGGFSFLRNESYDFDEERVDAFELSFRGSFFENRVKLNSNIFLNKYDGYQAVAFGPTGGSNDSIIINVDKGETYGIEGEMIVFVGKGLELNSSVGWLHTEIKEASGVNAYLVGNEFSYAPAVNAAVGFTQNFENGLSFGARLNYVGEYFSDIDNLATDLAGDYVTVSLNIGYETERFSVRAYAKNLFEEEILLRSATTTAQVGAPGSFGIVFDYNF
ncbi:TonB-dependent receptor domain-containing protein [Kordiimonas pumila]|uniref:TonB-dependent receptor domain-containing protein n=1 Tax=Kordiimonas pumila TaxID=2161677 RepID=A0ABV7D6G1_9PROT